MEDKIIKIFKINSNSYVSGEELSKKLGVSRAGIWKHIEKLRNLGYEIEAAPHLGYRLLRIPDKFIPEEVSSGLDTKIIGRRIYCFESVESTNNTAYKMAEEGAPEGTVILAEEQQKGRGRMQRHWASPKGGIYLSLILKPKLLPAETPKITLLAAVSVANAIRKSSGIRCLIRWPNDILVDSKKICGILIEMKAEQDTTQFLIVGIGLNVNTDSKLLPPQATSISQELGKAVSKVEVVKEILNQIEKHYQVFNEEGFDSIRNEWCNLSAILGKRIRVTLHGGIIEGQASDIDNSGALVVRLDNGFLQKVTAGDVILLR